MKINFNDIFFTCSLIELIGRNTLRKRSDVVSLLGKKNIAHIYAHADTLHCEPIAKTADTFIELCKITKGDFDNVAACKYAVPEYWAIGKVYARLIEDVHDGDDVVETLLNVYKSPISDMISNYNSDLFYQSRGFIKEFFLSNGCEFEDRNDHCPALRFRGFTDAWEQRELNNTVTFYNGQTYSPSDVIGTSGTLVLRSCNVLNGEIVLSDNVFINNNVVNSNNVLVGDIIVVVRNGSKALIGKHAQIKQAMNNTVIGAFMTGIRSQLPAFMNALLNTHLFTTEVEKNMGATINQITGWMFKKMSFNFPNNDEQQKIGKLFEVLDHLITLHQRKLDKLTKVKKSMLQKMFPQNGSANPEIRFSGFTDAWEQRKAKDLFESTVDKNHPELPVLAATQEYGMVKRDDNGINIYHDKRNESTYKRVLPGQFVIHLRSFQGGFAHSSIEGITSPAYTVFGFKESEKHYDIFWKYIFRSDEFIQRLETVTYGIRDGRSISYEEFLTMNFLVPSFEEQKQISTSLLKLDHLITLHQRKLEKLKKIKASCLEKMFV